MITLFKIFESKREYLNVNLGCCPVCATQGKVIDKEEFNEYSGEYTFKCPVCDFVWYNEWEDYGNGMEEIFSDEIEDFNRNSIEDGFYVDDNLYNKEKLEEYETMKKYNL